jgi:hypothetical protein
MKLPGIFRKFDLQSSANRFDWIIEEAWRVRQIRQQEIALAWSQLREADLARRRPIWNAVDESLRETDEGARANNTQKYKK